MISSHGKQIFDYVAILKIYAEAVETWNVCFYQQFGNIHASTSLHTILVQYSVNLLHLVTTFFYRGRFQELPGFSDNIQPLVLELTQIC